MPFFYTKNLTEATTYSEVAPWDFVLTETLNKQIREDKQSRQEWYHNTRTAHYFYTAIEGSNPNMRPSKENPPLRLHAFAADFDAKIPKERLDEILPNLRYKPAYWERSLGGNVRLVWLLEKPLLLDGYTFCTELLQTAVKWLELGMFPGLDEPAFTDPSRLLCNGCEWHATGAGPIPAAEVQAFYVAVARKFRFKPVGTTADIPLDVVEKAIRERFPAFEWPCSFEVGSQGPSFFVEGSVSTQSAIVHEGGIFTFAAHAAKPFYSWADILGPEFIRQFTTSSIAKATDDIWFDGRHYWKKNAEGIYESNTKEIITGYFKVSCRVSTKPGKDGLSPMDGVFNHLEHGPGRIAGAAPFVFNPPGVIVYQKERKLNTYRGGVMLPADELTPWGPSGKFSFLSSHIDFLFGADTLAKKYHLAWLKAFYTSGLNKRPYPGQNSFLMGAPATGKTMHTHIVIGTAVGGFCDASEYLVDGGGFNSELLEAPLWGVDDETFSDSSSSQARFQAMLKKAAANQDHKYSKKYEIPCMVNWEGRVMVTSNLDFISSRTLGQLDNSALDKTNLFLVGMGAEPFKFPDRITLRALVLGELPYLLRWVLEWEPPPEVLRDARYGYKAYHEEALLDRASQSGRFAPFKEFLISSLMSYFGNSGATEWTGTETQLMMMLHAAPGFSEIARNLKMEQTARYLEMVQNEGLVGCRVTTGAYKTRVWHFDRIGEPAKPGPALRPPSINTTGTPFEKQ